MSSALLLICSQLCNCVSQCRNHMPFPNAINLFIYHLFFIPRGLKWFKNPLELISCVVNNNIGILPLCSSFGYSSILLSVNSSEILPSRLALSECNDIEFQINEIPHTTEGSLGAFNKMKYLSELFKFLRVQ